MIIVGIGLAVLAAAVLAMRRRREHAGRRALARRQGWEWHPRPEEKLLARLDTVALMQIGHSRRTAEAFRAKGPTYIFPYVFETGFEHRRESHRWLVVMRDVQHTCARVTITRQDWLAVTAAGPASQELPLRDPQDTSRSDGGLVAIADDPEEWQARSKRALVRWLAEQPAERSWEILPGCVVGYEPGLLQETALVGLSAAAAELARLLMNSYGESVPLKRSPQR
ncbi:MAG: hypothetical protein JXQ75_17580 [Phycisphaerae bacterium]|nr:hypothetical protein [Phycisphaerae bacterium]